MKYVIKFIPVENGTQIEFDELWNAPRHKLLGFRPTPGKKVAGHIVVAVAQEGKRGVKSSAPRRLRAVGS